MVMCFCSAGWYFIVVGVQYGLGGGLGTVHGF